MKLSFLTVPPLVLTALVISLFSACTTAKVGTGTGDTGMGDMGEIEGAWALEQMLSEGSLKAIPAGVKAPELAFAEDGRLTGFTGVNRLVSAPWSADKKARSLRIGPAAITLMAALSMEAADTENNFLTRLSEVETYDFEGAKLLLKGGTGQVLLVFAKAN